MTHEAQQRLQSGAIFGHRVGWLTGFQPARELGVRSRLPPGHRSLVLDRVWQVGQVVANVPSMAPPRNFAEAMLSNE
ncbi:hypothetical protein Acsp02_29480 [Actinoplanes sp. NBRC 103695]|nr:hypothetical protein Acsp02_29480 [Actinoplanes sp. NBRC 103695]